MVRMSSEEKEGAAIVFGLIGAVVVAALSVTVQFLMDPHWEDPILNWMIVFIESDVAFIGIAIWIRYLAEC